MDINLTLLIQMAVFAVFVLFTMRFVWPPLSKAMEERQNKIADGLAAAERAHKELELAQQRAKDELRQAKLQSSEIIEKAMKQASLVVENAVQEAQEKAKQQLKLGKEQLDLEVNKAQTYLRRQVASLAIAATEKILDKEINPETNALLVDQTIEEILS